MAGFSVANNEHLIRSNTWETYLKRVLQDELMGNKLARMIPYWGGGALNIPSIGQALSRDYVEGQQIMYDNMDTGNFTFTPSEYKSAATYITNKMKQDTFYMNELVSSFVPAQHRALSVDMEVAMFKTPTPAGSGQTTATTNAINGAEHRWVGLGTNETLSPKDFSKANYALNKANVPVPGRIAIVDPSCVYAIETMTNLVNVSNNPTWGGIISTGAASGMRFLINIYGFDIYVSNYLNVNSGSESITAASGAATAAAGVNNLFFSTAADVLPMVGTIMQEPKVDSDYNHNFQREEYVTTCRFGYKFFRPENMVIVVTDTDQVGV